MLDQLVQGLRGIGTEEMTEALHELLELRRSTLEPVPELVAALRALHHRMSIVSPERVRDELCRLLGVDDPAAGLGLLGVPYPEEVGGTGLDSVAYAITIEELSRVSGSVGIIVSAHTSLGCAPLFMAGTDEQKERYLRPLASGAKLGASRTRSRRSTASGAARAYTAPASLMPREVISQRHAPGAPSLNLASMARSGLMPSLRQALLKAMVRRHRP